MTKVSVKLIKMVTSFFWCGCSLRRLALNISQETLADLAKLIVHTWEKSNEVGVMYRSSISFIVAPGLAIANHLTFY